ncbi:hypothetical protein FRC02_011337 [Tulasnella sp. 418]|nr:hypothetical protein FRC02_011337 [Tulasnella sp. 418]
MPGGRPPVSELCSYFQPKSSNEVALSGFMGLTRVEKMNYTKLGGFEELSHDGKYLAASDGSERIDIWEVDKPITFPFKSLVPPNNSWRAILGSWSSLPQYFMVVYQGAGIGVWDVKDLADMARRSIEVGEFTDFALTPDLQRIVLLNGASLKVYNTDGQCEFVTDRKHRVAATEISISKDGQHLLTSCDSGFYLVEPRWAFGLWEITIENGKAALSHVRQYYSSQKIYLGHANPQFGGPQEAMIVGMCDGALSIWDRYSDQLLHSSSLVDGYGDPVTGPRYHMIFRWNTTDPIDMVLDVDEHVFLGLPRA